MTTELQAAAAEIEHKSEPTAPSSDVEINHLIKQLDMGEPDYSDYVVAGHYFDAKDRYSKAMSMIKHRLFIIPQLRAHIAALEADNKRLREALSSALAWLCPDETTKFDGTIEDWERMAKAALAQTN